MVILIVSDTESAGGAATSTVNLSIALAKEGHQIYRLVASADAAISPFWSTIKFWQVISIRQRIMAKLRNHVPKILLNYYAQKRFLKILKLVNPDVINFHNILWAEREGITIDFYRLASQRCLTLVTMHDMWNIKGYPYDYYHVKDNRIVSNASNPAILNSSQLTKRRHLIFNQENLYFISPSHWLADLFRKDFETLQVKISVIPYGVDTEIYKPVDKVFARDVLGISSEKIIILSSAASLSYINKGFNVLLSTIHSRSNSDILLLMMGDDTEMGRDIFPSDLEVKKLGFINDKFIKNIVYNASDLLVFPSIADNLPNSILECLAAGTPVVAFNTCGIIDLVKDGKTGWLANELQMESFNEVFERALSSIKNKIDLKQECRQFIVDNFMLQLQALRYIELVNIKSK